MHTIMAKRKAISWQSSPLGTPLQTLRSARARQGGQLPQARRQGSTWGCLPQSGRLALPECFSQRWATWAQVLAMRIDHFLFGRAKTDGKKDCWNPTQNLAKKKTCGTNPSRAHPLPKGAARFTKLGNSLHATHKLACKHLAAAPGK